MSRKDDVKTIIASAKLQYVNIRKDYNRALRDESLDLRIPVKNLMENLRSSFDYMAHDIYESCCKANRIAAGKPELRRIYFPYGQNTTEFANSIGRSLPDLDILNPDVYDLIASIQPFRCNDAWLYDLCSIINVKKHDKLSAQIRSEIETYTVESKKGSVSIPVNNPNVKISSMPGSVKIFGVPAEFTSNGIRTAHSDSLSHKHIKWVSFAFEDTDVNVIGLLDKAVDRVTKFAERLYNKI